MPSKRTPTHKRYPPELRERAVRTVAETIAETGERSGVVARVARQLGIGEQTLRSWVPSHRAHRGMTPAEFAEAWTINRQLQLA